MHVPLSSKQRPLVPVIFLACFSLATVITAIQGGGLVAGESSAFVPSAPLYGGMVAICMAVSAFFRLRHFYKYVITAIFLLGMFGIISFGPLNFYVAFGSEDSKIQLDLISLAFGLLIYWTNSTRINAAIIEAMKPSKEKIRQRELSEIEEFKKRFSRKSTEELTQIVTTNTLVAPAVSAARQLLTERQSIRNTN
jgi:hypothetical protein